MSINPETLGPISTPDQVETRLGALEFTDGAPSPQTLEKVYDHLDFLHAVNVYLTPSPAPQPRPSARASTAPAPRTTRSSSSRS